MNVPRNQSRKPAYLFLGPEEGEKRVAVGQIREQIIADAGEIEEYSYFAFETPIADVVSLLRNGSLFAGHIFVRLRFAESIKLKDDLELLSSYLKSPPAEATLVFESGETRVDKRLETIVGPGGKRIFWEMFDNQKEGWVRAYVQRRGGTIDQDAVELLLDLVENNTVELRTEIDRLMAFVGKHLCLDDVDRHIYHAREENVFSLFDAVAAGDFPGAMEILSKLSASADMGQTLGGLSWQFDRLFRLHRLRLRHTDESAIFSRQGIDVKSKRAQKTYTSAARIFDSGTVNRIVVLLNETEEAIRSLPTQLHFGIMQDMLYSILRREGRWRPFADLPVE